MRKLKLDFDYYLTRIRFQSDNFNFDLLCPFWLKSNFQFVILRIIPLNQQLIDSELLKSKFYYVINCFNLI